jgi:adenosylhomocysteine nucleosidase
MISVVVIISANIEWDAIRSIYPNAKLQHSPYGDWFDYNITVEGLSLNVIILHGGWGKISAAGSTQFVIDRWKPDLLVNLGTCGGFGGEVEGGSILLVERTVVYDIIEQMGDFDEHIAHYSTDIDLNWLAEPYPINVQKATLASGDRDLFPQDILELRSRYGAIAGDWESGAIAFVAARNKIKVLILRGVSDLVAPDGGEAYGNIALYRNAAQAIMKKLIDSLPAWIEKFVQNQNAVK